MIETPKLDFLNDYSPLGIKRVASVPFIKPSAANNAGVKTVIGSNAVQATQKPVSPTGDVQSSTSVGYDSGIGWWIGFDQGTPKLFIGNSGGNKLLWDGDRLTIKGDFIIGGTVVTVDSATDIQPAIDLVSAAGGGRVILEPGTYNMTSHIVIPSSVSFEGSGPTSIVDFGSAAYQIQIVGTNAYTTGTLSVTNGLTAIVGVGTTWTSAMVGRSILLEDFWYEITARTDNTHITIGSPYLGTTIAGGTYTIATTVDDTAIRSMTIESSSIALVKARYISNLTIDSVNFFDGLVGIDGDDSSFIVLTNDNADTCGTGMTFDNFKYGTFLNSNITNATSGGGIICNGISNWSFEIFAMQNITGTALSIQNGTNTGIEDFSIRQVTGIGINFVATNGNITVMDGNVSHATSDAMKLTATTDGLQIVGNNFQNNTGYGVNIAASSCDGNIIGMNYFASNTAGAAADSGTSTVIKSNSGLSDN